MDRFVHHRRERNGVIRQSFTRTRDGARAKTEMVKLSRMSRRFFMALWCCLALVAGATQGAITYNVSLDTTPLIGNTNGPFYVDFRMTDGSGGTDPNNWATISNISFGGGTATSTPLPTNGFNGTPAGDLYGTVSLTDNVLFTQFQQPFTPGTNLTFQLQLTTNGDPPGDGSIQDEFHFSIDWNDPIFGVVPMPVANFASGNALLAAFILPGGLSVLTYQTDGGSAPGVTLGPPTFEQLGGSGVPEPSTLLLMLSGFGAVYLARRGRRQ